ncbi:MAG TPA: RHS repeat-associated core domain-containing protein, partial [Myxococcota bacterium]|nr:RHS repeat-associated core domain-containing protein [Myxococcota bacterium]
TGQEHEPHTGLVRFAHRYLSTQTGQWLSPDPAFLAVTEAEQARLPEAVARYSYVLNNPGTFVDPNGLSRWGNFKASVGDLGKGISRRARQAKAWIGGRVAAAGRGLRARAGRLAGRFTARPGRSRGLTDFDVTPLEVQRADDALGDLLRQAGQDPATAGTLNPRAAPRGPRPRVNSIDSVGTVDTVASDRGPRLQAVPPGLAPSQVVRLTGAPYPSQMSLDFFYVPR